MMTRPYPHLQHRLTAALVAQDGEALRALFPADSRARGRLLSCQGPMSCGWLTAVPAYSRYDHRTCLNNFQFRTQAAVCLGLPLPLARLGRVCACGAAVDEFGDHFFLCPLGASQRILKHNLLRDTFVDLLAEVGIPAQTEVPLRALGMTPPNADPNNQRMDIFFVADGVGYLCDVTVTHPLRPDDSAVVSHQRIRRENAQLPGGTAARHAERRKELLYGSTVRAVPGYVFVPLAAETCGRWGQQTIDLLHKLARRRAPLPACCEEDRASFYAGFMSRWAQRLSVALAQWNACQLSYRAHCAAEAQAQQRASAFPEDLISRGPYRPHFRLFFAQDRP
ncbi:unnamed protein product [Vitrella brassicaformis CCMP3155]|uniref:Uncharacterized protein n=1 Tax=Vitrella brassicaformis (strain CCMP3155) TaxID=1169540 RepID=A0A0G4GKX9_VITBC|nr:unnamed protein product [Vitrella brassicaformis CCMP3155]|eukprot:CEM30652.1 unnamed protein product [Vitrella brassicaformis CCMP3155]